MEKRKAKPKDPGLEDELRKMILNNVTIGGSGPQPTEQQRQSRSPRNSTRGSHDGETPRSQPNARQMNTSSDRVQHQGSGQRWRRGPATPQSASARIQGGPPQSPDPGVHSQSSHQLPAQIDPNSYRNRGQLSHRGRGGGGPRSAPLQSFNEPRLWNAPRQAGPPPFEDFMGQCQFLDRIASVEIPNAQMSAEEHNDKEDFRQRLEAVCCEAVGNSAAYTSLRLELKSFGSLRSGFATKGSDMDLAIALSEPMGSGLPDRAVPVDPVLLRILEKTLLHAGFGARLLTRTRVPIIKICEKPTAELYSALSDERQKWEHLPDDKKYAPPSPQLSASQLSNEKKETESQPTLAAVEKAEEKPVKSRNRKNPKENTLPEASEKVQKPATDNKFQQQGPKTPRAWLREKKLGPLDFPKQGVGIQCDINFSNDLALYNTHLLRCYSLCDPRVVPLVLFVKAWAKRRKINSSYSGTLSSYGYVLMVLHFLANVANPAVIPNLQRALEPPATGTTTERQFIDGHDVRFMNNEDELRRLAMSGRLTSNNEPLGALIRNFFQYYANTNFCFGIGRGFQWTSEVLSLRHVGGTLTKAYKGWTGAKTTTVGDKEVRNRYLFAIEDPFELEHNVARTVTHNGVVAIRDEFRRAWRIINSVGREEPSPEQHAELFAEVVEKLPEPRPADQEDVQKEHQQQHTQHVVDADMASEQHAA